MAVNEKRRPHWFSSRRFSNFSLHKLFILDTNSKSTRLIHANWLRPCALGILSNFFSIKVINRWNLLDQLTVDAPSIKIRDNCPTGNRWKRALFTWPKKHYFGSLSNCGYSADRAQSLPWPATNIWLTTFQISSKSVYFQRRYSRPREGHSKCAAAIKHFQVLCEATESQGTVNHMWV